ncbi:Protein SRG1 [Capsicum annuum]|nr:Protein SRG1 [Capsicum annuum]KAF3676328.1 Protein SRG1 [Capsicum annuum]
MEVNYKNVPSVQEMAKKKLVTIPSRYVRDDQDHSVASSNKEAPVIDMQRLINSNDHDSMNIELQKLHFAAKEWGFFQLINHGVSSSVVEKMKHESQAFFDLPLEEKNKFGRSPGDTDGFGQLLVVSDKQKLDWVDIFYLKTAPPYLRMPIFFKLPLSLREAIEEYAEEIKELTMKVLKMLGKAVGIKAEEVDNLFDKGMQSMRMNYYPPCPQPELAMGLSPHSDASALTILLQVNDTEGLQIRKNGIWIPIVPLPNAFIVNIGDAFEIFSNGIYRSIVHRSVVSSEKERISVATFQSPRLDGELGPASTVVTADNPPTFRKIGAAEFYRGFLTRELVGKSYMVKRRRPSSTGRSNAPARHGAGHDTTRGGGRVGSYPNRPRTKDQVDHDTPAATPVAVPTITLPGDVVVRMLNVLEALVSIQGRTPAPQATSQTQAPLQLNVATSQAPLLVDH